MTMNWPLQVARRNEGRYGYVTDWAVEKLCQVVEGLALAREVPMGDSWVRDRKLQEGLYEGYRNACKLAAWMAGNTDAYSEDATRKAYEDGREGMRREVEVLLAPLLHQG